MKFLQFLFLITFLTANFSPTSLNAENKSEAQSVYYQCSMHPQIISDKPGNCPICGMRLSKVEGHAAQKLTLGRAPIKIESERQKLIGMKTQSTEVRSLNYTIHTVGHVAYDPDIANTLAEFRDAYTTYRKVKRYSDGLVRERAENLLEIAQAKLRLAGFSSGQFEQMKNSNLTAKAFDNYISTENLILPQNSVWVNADLYESDSEIIQPGYEAKMNAPALPGSQFTGIVKTVDPVFNELPRRVRIRIETPHQNKLTPGMALDLEILIPLGEKLSIPEDSVLDSGEKKVVFVVDGDNIQPREVETGILADGFYEIIKGLRTGEKVVTSANFLIDSESRMLAAAQTYRKNDLFESKATEPKPAHVHSND